MNVRQYISAVLVASFCLVAGCTNKGAADASLASAIQGKLKADDTTKASTINVDVKSGVVTLTGDVPSSDVELQAMKLANGTAGVSTVTDQLKVNPSLAQNTPPPAPVAGSYPPASQSPATGPSTANTPATPPPAAAEPASAVPDSAPADSASAPASPVRHRSATLTVPTGERLQVRMTDAIDSRTNTVGQTFRGSLDAPLVHGNRVVVPAGAPVTVELSNASSAGRIRGRSELQVRATSITVGSRSYDVTSDVYDQAGSAKGKQTAIRSGIGAAAGALIGGLAGGGKGAAIGAGAGGGAGLGYQFFTHGAQVKIPSESVITFRLAAPLTVQR